MLRHSAKDRILQTRSACRLLLGTSNKHIQHLQFTTSVPCLRTSPKHPKNANKLDKQPSTDIQTKIHTNLGIKHHPVNLEEITEESKNSLPTNTSEALESNINIELDSESQIKSNVEPEPESENVEQPKSFNEIIQDMQARQLNYIRKVSIPKSSKSPTTMSAETIAQKWIFHDTDGSTNQQMYLANLAEGDLIETWSGDMGVIVQVPDYVNFFKFAVLDHHGSVQYYPSARSFAVKIPQFVKRTTPSDSLDPQDSLSSLIRVIDNDPTSPVVTVVTDLRKEVCPRIKKFIKSSQSHVKSVEVELEKMFSELQESSDPINVSLFEVAFAVERNLQSLESVSKNGQSQDSKPISNHNKYDILKAHFPPHGFEGSRRHVSSTLLYTVYTSIGTMFNKRVLFDANDHPTPNTLTLLPFSLENEQDRAIDAMRYANQAATALTSVYIQVEEGISIENPKGTSGVRNHPKDHFYLVERAPILMKDLLELEDAPWLSKSIIGVDPKVSPTENGKLTTISRKPDIIEVNRGVINVIKRFATKDITSQDLTTRSVVSLFLKNLDFFRCLVKKQREAKKIWAQNPREFARSAQSTMYKPLEPPASASSQITETEALNFLTRTGIILPDQNPLRLQSKLKPIEAGASRIEKLTEKSHLEDKYHRKTQTLEKEPTSAYRVHGESYESNGLPDRVASLRQELPSDLTVYCIDSADAHEIDDGISVANTNERTWKIYIHIADPASALALDGRGSDGLLKHAYNQTSTAYYPEAVIPMFPKWFTHSLGLIQQTEEEKLLAKSSFRRCLTFEIDYDSQTQDFDIDGVKVYPAVTRSIRQITYDQVNKILADPSITDAKTATDLKNMYTVAKAFSKHRFVEGGAMALQIPRPSARVSKDTFPGSTSLAPGLNVAVDLPKTRVSNELVAEFMILCNHATARYMSNHQLPGIYRSQNISANTRESRDELDKILQKNVSQCDWSVMPWSATDPLAEIGKGIGPKLQVRDSLVLLNKIKSATLGVKSQRHAALGIDEYMHATSPLRRFQDVITHWQIQSHLLEEAEAKKHKSFKSSHTLIDSSSTPFRSQHHLSGAYLFDPSQVDTMSIRLMRNQTLLKRASQQSNLFWTLRVLRQQLGFAPGAACRSSMATTDCIITSKALFGFQNAYSVELGVFVTIDLQGGAAGASASSSQEPVSKRLYNLGESVKCEIVDIDQMQYTVTARPL